MIVYFLVRCIVNILVVFLIKLYVVWVGIVVNILVFYLVVSLLNVIILVGWIIIRWDI